ncbi:hypothetical protein [Flavobacterium sp.]|uniref:hypothetical protein n=1 Tax=Flavobacterium sp. TaxID=239 RepID=UPI0033402E3B
MPTTVTVGSNYNGKVAGGLFLKAWKEADTLKNNLVTIYPNVNSKLSLRKSETTNGRREYTCGHTPAGSITLAEKSIIPTKFKDDWDLCKETFRATWTADEMGASAANDVFPKEILDGIIASKLANEASYTDDNIWQGVDATNGYDGFLTQFAADVNIVTVDGEAIDKTNVIAELEKAVAAIPPAIRRRTLNVMVSPDVAQAYNFYLIDKGTVNGLGGNANTELVFGKHRLVEVGGLPEATIVIAETGNLGFVTGALEDHNSIQVVDEDAIGLLTGKVRGTMVYNVGVIYVYAPEIVWYRIPEA